MQRGPKAPSSNWDPMSADSLSGEVPARILCKESHIYYSGYFFTPKLPNTNFLMLPNTVWSAQNKFKTKKCRNTQASSFRWNCQPPPVARRVLPTLLSGKDSGFQSWLETPQIPRGALKSAPTKSPFSLQWDQITVFENPYNSIFP